MPAIDVVFVLDGDAAGIAKLVQRADERGPVGGIRGQASPEDTEALLDEGIPVLPLPVPKALKGPVQ